MEIVSSAFDSDFYWIGYNKNENIYFDLIKIHPKPDKIKLSDLCMSEYVLTALKTGDILTSFEVTFVDDIEKDLQKYPSLRRYIYLNDNEISINCKVCTELLFDDDTLIFTESPFENMYWIKYGQGCELIEFKPDLNRISINELKSKRLIYNLLWSQDDEIFIEEQYLADLNIDIEKYPELSGFIAETDDGKILKGKFVTKIVF